MRTIKRLLSLSFFALILASGAVACGRTTLPSPTGGSQPASGTSATSSHSSQSAPDCTRAIGGQALYRSTHASHHPKFCTDN